MSRQVTFDYSKAGSFISEEEMLHEEAYPGCEGDPGIQDRRRQ